MTSRSCPRGGPAGAATATPAPERTLPTEECVEQVVEAAAAATEDVLDPRAGAGVDACLPEAVVPGALVGIGQHLVGPRDLLEPLGRRGVARVGVGVQLASRAGGRPA